MLKFIGSGHMSKYFPERGNMLNEELYYKLQNCCRRRGIDNTLNMVSDSLPKKPHLTYSEFFGKMPDLKLNIIVILIHCRQT